MGQEFFDKISEHEEQIGFALEVLEDGLADAKAVLGEKRIDELTSADLVIFTVGEWDEIMSTIEFAIEILKGKARRGQ